MSGDCRISCDPKVLGMPSSADLVQLASSLREEHIFVKAETQQLSRLNRQLAESTEALYHEAWIARRQRRALEILLQQRQDLPADGCLRYLNAAASTVLVDGYKVLGYKEASYGECLKVVRQNPELLAECLVRCEKLDHEKVQEALRIILGSLYGYGLIPEDQEYSLKLLKSLIEIQLDANSNPRRLLKNSSFTYCYKIFVENLHEAKLYLAAALHQPILQVLAEDDHFLDFDAGKLSYRIPAEEKRRKFGKEGTPRFEQNFKNYRAVMIQRLVRLVKRFIQGLQTSLFCFPPSLCWIISQVYERIQSQQAAQSTLPAIVCTDLVFSHFICPAIIQPEPYALTSDIPVSSVARYNLMQIAQVLQTLAVSKWETIDSKHLDVYGAFEPDCVWKVLDRVVEMRTSDILMSPLPSSDSVNRSSVFISLTELNFLIGFLKESSADRPGSRVASDIIRNLVNSLPVIEAPPKEETFGAAPTPPLEMKSKIHKSNSKHEALRSSTIEEKEKDLLEKYMMASEVMVVSLGPRECSELGFIPEQKVLALNKGTPKKRTRFSEEQDSFGEYVGSVDDEAMSAFSVCSSIPDSVSLTGPGKRNSIPGRFDDTSSVPSEGLIAVCEEIQGRHSIASSVEDEATADDNLSDAVSPNISGHASPTVSGRDTPSPQNEQVDLNNLPNLPAAVVRPLQPSDLPITVQKSNREDVPEKFGKFYIPLDETRSTMSDAWSTEVAASEIEALNDVPIIPPPLPEVNPVDDPVFAVAAAGGFDSDDDRWSVDVAASVSNASQEPLEERMRELEIDPQMDRDLALTRDQELRENAILDVVVPVGPVLPNAPGKYVSFATDDQFHHYPPEHDLLGPFGSPVNRPFHNSTEETKEEDPTANLPLNVFLPIPNDVDTAFPTSVPSSCSSFSNLSGFSNYGSDQSMTKMAGVENGSQPSVLNAFDPYAPVTFNPNPSPTFAYPPADKPTIPRKGSLTISRETVTIKELPNRQSSLKDSPIINNRPDKFSPSLSHSPGKKGSFLKSIATSFRGKQKRMSGKVDLPHAASLGDFNTPPKAALSPAVVNESPDDILAKYRKKAAASAGATPSTPPVAVPNGTPLLAPPSASLPVVNSAENLSAADFAGIGEDAMLETAKRKVRIVLNSFDVGSVPCLKMRFTTKNSASSEPPLLSFLKIQLSEAIGLQDRSLIAQLHEAIRCVKALDSKGTRKLIELVKADYRNREIYTAYLIRSRKSLLNSLQHIDNLSWRTRRDSDVCCKYFLSVCISQFLEKRERDILNFVREFQKATVYDEKTALMESFLMHLHSQMDRESLWRACSEHQTTDAQETLERQIISRVYQSAFYPNDEVDRARDEVLEEHIRKLATILTPDHKDLKISKVFHLECPWPSAQAEIAEINAYKTPKDKVQCVLRCSTILMNLLSLASDSSVPAADDFMPALVYVLIRANPPSLLSTVQYVNNFYGNRLAGEESYWWTQFASAIEYTKNMDYESADVPARKRHDFL
ncbi:GTPase-activating protein and VPS9 domain-containing protein 1-like [Paramacrobiotus metropolitanus]|uniref:GTPase-activating protein and VPS9 domain-containing protein 1-like n=1 Tax=Paramacrobiotus metropolitanus TaxID=2943436 RepID=UPI0024456C09|nr:GTPase-activating protein and VPS9 domain-containing protein 1-like [Paramacrobiotus metropolitanus]